MLSLHQVDTIEYLEIYFEKTNREKSVGIFGSFFFILATVRQRDEKHNPNLISI